MPQLLPHSDSPRLRGPKLGMPLVTVVVSDAEVTRLQMAGVNIDTPKINCSIADHGFRHYESRSNL
jgi:hypothetical protein